MYLFGAGYSVTCYLGIETTSAFGFAILGDAFLQHNTVVFNKINNTVGFINNYQNLKPYI